MNSRFNLYSRTEEEKTKDILIYEKKAKAQEICVLYEKVRKRSNLAAFVTAVVSAVIAFHFFYISYDNENIVGMLLSVLAVAAITVIAKLIFGAVLSHSLAVFVRWGVLCAKWKDARKIMHEYEARFADQTVFEDDLKKAENKLLSASDAIIAFAEEKGIGA